MCGVENAKPSKMALLPFREKSNKNWKTALFPESLYMCMVINSDISIVYGLFKNNS